MKQEEIRTGKPTNLVEIASKMLSTTSESSKIQGIQNKILQAQTAQSNELTILNLAEIAVKVCTECGMKKENFPSEEMLMLCLKSWNERFRATEDKTKTGMSIQEIILAFEMNINGELERKVEHFHCFSREFFCDVCIEYLKKKKDALKYVVEEPKQEDTKSLPPADTDKQIAEAIITDFKDWNETGKLNPNYTIRTKLELLLQMFDLGITEITLIKIRERAAVNILNRNAKERLELDPDKQVGRFNTLLHQSARLKSGKLLNDKDEQEIRYECDVIIYTDCLSFWKVRAQEFIDHVRNPEELV